MDSEQERPNIRPKKKKKKKGKVAKRSLPQSVRLERAKKWLETYSGENILKDYRKKFATDRMQTLQELQLLGLTFTEEQIAKEKRAVEARRQQELAKKRKRKLRRQEKKQGGPHPVQMEQDDRFFFIAGYTSGGAPYGVTWEEMGLKPWEEIE